MTRQQLIRQQRAIRQQLDAMDTAKWVRENRRFVGTYWKYRNSYSLPEQPSDYWWVYRKLTAIHEQDQHFYALMFQTDKDGKITIDQHEYCHGPSNWTPCTEDEFLKALAQVKDAVAMLHLNALDTPTEMR